MLLVVGLGLWISYTGLTARTELQAAAKAMDQVSDHLRVGNASSAAQPLAAAQEHSSKAADLTSGPDWWIATRVPFIGDDLEAVSIVAGVADELSHDALPSAVTAGKALDPEQLMPRNGRFDFTGLRRAAPELLVADEVVRAQSSRMATIDLSALLGPVRRQVSAVELQLNVIAATSATAARVAKVGPWLLDGKKPRRLLVAFNNNAEIRATGGLPGALGVLTFDRGKISFGEQASPGDIGVQRHPAGSLTDAERTIWSDRMVYLSQDTNFTPDYPRGAALLQTMWERKFRKVDGVLSVDPIAMSYLLRGSDPMSVAGYDITSANAVQVLLNQIYRDIRDPERQDEIFAEVAAETFDQMVAGKLDTTAAFQGIQRATQERRISLYLHDPEMQRVLAGSAISGGLDFGDGPHPQVGVYFNDGTPAKMGYYLRYSTNVDAVSCANSTQQMRVTVRMTSQMPRDLSKLTPSILGPAKLAPKGVLLTYLHVMAPAGGSIGQLLADGREPVDVRARLGDREISSIQVALEPGQTRTLTYQVTSGKGQVGDAELQVTPGVADLGIGRVDGSVCQ